MSGKCGASLANLERVSFHEQVYRVGRRGLERHYTLFFSGLSVQSAILLNLVRLAFAKLTVCSHTPRSGSNFNTQGNRFVDD